MTRGNRGDHCWDTQFLLVREVCERESAGQDGMTMGKVRRKSEVISSLRAEYPTTGNAGGPSLLGGLELGWGRCSVSSDTLNLVANPETEGSLGKKGLQVRGKDRPSGASSEHTG